jgi:hypothetical protein
MNTLEYYNRQKNKWEENEIEEIKKQYEIEEMTISQIGDIHHRTPGSISYKLNKLGIISHTVLARGYNEYKNSNLYKEILIKSKKEKKESKTKLELNIETTSSNNTIDMSNDSIVSNNEILDLKNEIISLKKDVKEILHLLNNLYDFENKKM